MDFYFTSIEDLFSLPKERTFTNRTKILNLLNESLTKLNEGSETYQIFSIHGIGGIGKTRLVNEFIRMISPEPVTYVSFEIEKCNEIINNLYKIRKTISLSCPFFDYALLRYWEMTNPAALNDSFMQLFHKGFFINLLDVAAEVIGCSSTSLQNEIPIPSAPSASAIVDFMNSIYQKGPQLLHNKLFKTILMTNADQLIDKLPILLGIEIKQKIVKGVISNPIFIFDSYQESQPYSESKEWLLHLINAIEKGLFIITSREELHWKIKSAYFITQNLESYPKEDAQRLLEETIHDQPELVEIIIESTQRIPIYIDLALNVYENEKVSIGNILVKKALFRDRHMLVHHFISHLKPSWQAAVLNLATIRVFNYDIFIHFIEQKILDCAPYEYDSIIKSNLFSYVSKSQNSSLHKLHDVFCTDVQAGRTINECYIIFRSYLDYICYRRDYILQENNGVTLAALLQNVLYLAITFEERMDSDTQLLSIHKIQIIDVEKILDIFFTLVSNKVHFSPPPFDNIRTDTMKKVCQFIYAKTYEKINTLKTIQMLESIGDTSCFGKHYLSYEAVLFYTKSLAGHYKELETWTNTIEQKLNIQTKEEWFYNRIKIYQADCSMLQGRFKSALASLVLIKNNYITSEDYYSIHRAIGHIQRFNLLLSDANSTYNNLMKKYHNNTVYREYLATNLVETECYFPTIDFIKNTEKLLCSMHTVYNIKNKGKVLYALAIANTVKKHYKSAQKHINSCLQINKEDGYQSGELFAYMAQSYLDYACTGCVDEKTVNCIEHLFLQNGVYKFFMLPLAIMKNDLSAISEIKSTYDWIDFARTESEYRRFLSKLRDM